MSPQLAFPICWLLPYPYKGLTSPVPAKPSPASVFPSGHFLSVISFCLKQAWTPCLYFLLSAPSQLYRSLAPAVSIPPRKPRLLSSQMISSLPKSKNISFPALGSLLSYDHSASLARSLLLILPPGHLPQLTPPLQASALSLLLPGWLVPPLGQG